MIGTLILIAVALIVGYVVVRHVPAASAALNRGVTALEKLAHHAETIASPPTGGPEG